MSFRSSFVQLGALAIVFAFALIAIPSLLHAQCESAQSRPFELGVSGSNIKSFRLLPRHRIECCEGTLGSLVQDDEGNRFVLSNNHVLARQSTPSAHAAKGQLIVQPGLIQSECVPETANGV